MRGAWSGILHVHGHSPMSSQSLGSPPAPLPVLTPHRGLTESLPLPLTLSDTAPVPPPPRLPRPPIEGLLTLRAKPPSEAEYTDVLQKIKYAFSLLVRTRPDPGVGGQAGHKCGPSAR